MSRWAFDGTARAVWLHLARKRGWSYTSEVAKAVGHPLPALKVHNALMHLAASGNVARKPGTGAKTKTPVQWGITAQCGLPRELTVTDLLGLGLDAGAPASAEEPRP